MKKIGFLYFIIISVLPLYSQSQYKIANKIHLPGDGGWDYLFVDETDQLLLDALARQVQASLENRYLQDPEKMRTENFTGMGGSFPIHDLPDIGLHDESHGHEDGDYTTVAGMVLAVLGHIPTAPGEVVQLLGFTAEVVEVTGRAITRVRLRPLQTAAEEA